VPATNRLVCVTNRVPATNYVFCFTNTIPPTNIVRCATNSAGILTCFTNTFPGTNFVSCFTIQVPGSNVITCQLTNLPAITNVVCTTNRVRYETNVFQCVTNRVPCRGATPCIDALRIKFGPVVSLGVNGSNGVSTGQVFAVTSGGVGTGVPTTANQTGNVVTIHFATPICPGESSVFVGLVSSNAPHDVDAKLVRNDLKTEEVEAHAPRIRDHGIACDFSALRAAIEQLGSSDLIAPNDSSREGRRKSLLNAIDQAIDEANDDDADDALDELEHVIDKVGGKWFSAQSSQQLRALLEPLVRCLRDADGDHDGDDDDDDHDDDDHRH
jgi:hypothetical protein